ncbi:hypothetical protein SK128_011466, partial [Halocaridina rubra]
VCILSCLRPAVSREVYDALVRCADVNQILQILQEAQQEKIPISSLPAKLSHIDHPTRNLLRRLGGAGLTDENIDQVLFMREHLARHQRQKMATEATRSNASFTVQLQPGVINLESLKRTIPTHHCDLMPEDGSIDLSTLSISQKGLIQSPSMTMNEEWQAMFGTADDRISPNRTPDN